MSRTLKGRMTRVALALLFCLACARGRTLPPDRALGVVLGKVFNPSAFTQATCVSARAFAFRRGSYSIVTDDVLFGVPHEHPDTTAVLAALDSFTVCVGETRELGATAVVTLSDSIVGNAHIFWPDSGQAPTFDRMSTILQRAFGQPTRNKYGDRFWSADSLELSLNHEGRQPCVRALRAARAPRACCSHLRRFTRQPRSAQ